MPHTPSMRHAWRAALALATSLSAACGGDPKPPPTPDPPQVQLNVPEAIVAGTGLKFIVTVSGCDTVSSLNVYDRDTFLKTFPYSSGTVTLELLSADIPYRTAGLAANLSLKAEAVCADGRKNYSMPQPATFFPVSRVLDDPQGAQQVFNMPFIVEGTGSNTTYYSCAGPKSGIHTLYRQPTNGTVQTLTMPTLCTPDTVITAPVNGKRWVWTPGSSAFAVDSSFQITARSRSDLALGALTVLSDGDALLRSSDGGRVSRQAHGADLERWVYPGEQGPVKVGTPIAPPVVRSDGALVFATHEPTGDNRAQIVVTVLDASSGTLASEIVIRDLLTAGGTPPAPSAAFSADGRVLYLGFLQASNQGQVLACAADAPGCEGANLRWTTNVLPAPVKALVPYANGSRIAAVGAQRVWLLDASTGAVRTRDGASLDANGALNVLYVQPGRPPSSDVYFLAGPARTVGGGATLPVEIFGVDQGSNGDGRELFRFQVPVSMGAAVDDEGRLWLRTGLKLIQTLPTSHYRSARP
ncbi:hypothetical protein [Myxococcus sp. RHSTA-1-4]|uniref:hypothetical protein n=1 Tax=Myxococcus sp. RHSTA-1-4 TaxID=2874601 RepID=UPI001CC0B42A|nr:hypothetical protein [Myxococcus sp. RHSTA-1-4]MBZ4417752.1 hypothetical protein [Myxococcus sp. RHSTA-1-4]